MSKGKWTVLALLLLIITISGCTSFDERYETAQEEYEMGWIVHNVSDSTDTDLTYTKDNVATYNYSYNLPGNVAEWYGQVLFWKYPVHKNESGLFAATTNEIAVPLNRTYYVRGVNPVSQYYQTNWTFENYVEISYDSSDTYSYEERCKSLKPQPGDSREIYFGGPDFLPSNLVIEGGYLEAGRKLLKGRNNRSWIERDTADFTSEMTPSWTVKNKTGHITSGDFQDWNEGDLFYSLDSGEYRANLTLPTGYPLWETVKISSSFNYSKADKQPPQINWIDADPRFQRSKNYSVNFNVSDNKSISDVSATYKEISGRIKTGNTGNYTLESEHPYSNDLNKTWKINKTGFTNLSIHFVNMSIEGGWDYLRVYNAMNHTVKEYSGDFKDVWSPSVSGDTAYIQLDTDGSITEYGFYIDKVLNGSFTTTETGWMSTNTNNQSNSYTSVVNVTNDSTEKIGFKININDTTDNEVSYIIEPIAFSEETTDITLNLNKNQVKEGEEITADGELTASERIAQGNVKLYQDDVFLGSSKTTSEGAYSRKIKTGCAEKGEENLSAVYPGAGVYSPVESWKTINVSTPTYREPRSKYIKVVPGQVVDVGAEVDTCRDITNISLCTNETGYWSCSQNKTPVGDQIWENVSFEWYNSSLPTNSSVKWKLKFYNSSGLLDQTGNYTIKLTKFEAEVPNKSNIHEENKLKSSVKSKVLINRSNWNFTGTFSEGWVKGEKNLYSEDFESGIPKNWTSWMNKSWEWSNVSYSGNHSIKAGNISEDEVSAINFTYTTDQVSFLEFKYKLACGGEGFGFYKNGAYGLDMIFTKECDETGWKSFSYRLEANKSYTFVFAYVYGDLSYSNNTVYLDNISIKNSKPGYTFEFAPHHYGNYTAKVWVENSTGGIINSAEKKIFSNVTEVPDIDIYIWGDYILENEPFEVNIHGDSQSNLQLVFLNASNSSWSNDLKENLTFNPWVREDEVTGETWNESFYWSGDLSLGKGKYNLTGKIKDEAGQTVSYASNVWIYPSRNITLFLKDSGGNAATRDVEFGVKEGTTWNWKNYYGISSLIDEEIANASYFDRQSGLRIEKYGEGSLFFKNITMSRTMRITNEMINLSRRDIGKALLYKGQAFNHSYSYSSLEGEVEDFDWKRLVDRDRSALYFCNNWSYQQKRCTSSWENKTTYRYFEDWDNEVDVKGETSYAEALVLGESEYCGNGYCGSDESKESCSADCGQPEEEGGEGGATGGVTIARPSITSDGVEELVREGETGEAVKKLTNGSVVELEEASSVLNEVSNTTLSKLLGKSVEVDRQRNFSQLILRMNSTKTLQGLFQSEVGSGASILESATEQDKEKTAKLMDKGIERNLGKTASIADEMETEAVAKLLIEISELPETPEKAAKLLEGLEVKKRNEVVEHLTSTGKFEVLDKIFAKLEKETLADVFESLSLGSRNTLQEGLPSNLIDQVPGELEVSDLKLNSLEVAPGEPLHVTVQVKNTGLFTLSKFIKLRLNGSVEDRKQVRLRPGEETNLSFSFSKEREGNYKLQAAGLKSSFEVRTQRFWKWKYLIVVSISALVVILSYFFKPWEKVVSPFKEKKKRKKGPIRCTVAEINKNPEEFLLEEVLLEDVEVEPRGKAEGGWWHLVSGRTGQILAFSKKRTEGRGTLQGVVREVGGKFFIKF